ncbi:hypothetical protein [Kibdelosporangium aridum]|uniref:Uncharacterized protein n=1 Tax=Kibdelosporangium aridum TaxID=2030 RepID=A0A1Y5XRB6_KIBAR|nr:hypothetical protein [Kibdelosporangium aridum]SMD07421.1 hypothetical protein SAMN05661093_04206 [Kibdelosporangium aridum]
MPNGFGTVPEELRNAANKIGDVVSKVVGAVWQPPSGDYGHQGVQMGWSAFIEDMKKNIDGLREKADGHGNGLISAATSYLERETGVGDLLGKAGEFLGDTASGLTGGAIGIAPNISSRLNPESAPGVGPAAAPGRMVF